MTITPDEPNINSIATDGVDIDINEWYIAISDQVKGPFDAEKIRQMFEDCEIDGLTSVLRKGTNSWISLCKDEILKSNIASTDEESINDYLPVDEKFLHVRDFDEKDAINEYKNNKQASVTSDVKQLERLKKQQYLKRKRERIDRGEFIASQKNCSVYITGLPNDVTMEELQSVFKKAGVIKIDPITTLPKVKIYRDENNAPKGDATITFLNRESVSLCLKYFDDYYFRPNVKIHVEQAQFKPNADKKRPFIDPKLRKKKFLAAKYEAQRISSWNDEMDDGTGRRIVIAKPMFSLDAATKYIKGHIFYESLRDEIYEEVVKYVDVEKITPMARHPQGIVCFKFKTTKEAEVFIAAFRDRIFDGNKLEVYFYDGKTDLSAQCIPEPDKTEGASDSDYFNDSCDEDIAHSEVVDENINKPNNSSASEVDDYLNKLIE